MAMANSAMNDAAAGEVIQPLIDRLPQDVEDSARALLRSMDDRALMVATAESCTGGLLCALLTDIEGCSHAFDRGFVVYSPEAKMDMLGIDRALLDGPGPVSREVALAMAHGAIAHSRADIALAITGNAGPAEPGEEAGLVHIACMRRGVSPLHRELHLGKRDRGAVRTEAIRAVLALAGEAMDAEQACTS